MMHGHWVVPGGALAAAALAGRRAACRQPPWIRRLPRGATRIGWTRGAMGLPTRELRDGVQRRSPRHAPSRSAHPASGPSPSLMASIRGGSVQTPAIRAATSGGMARRGRRRDRVCRGAVRAEEGLRVPRRRDRDSRRAPAAPSAGARRRRRSRAASSASAAARLGIADRVILPGVLTQGGVAEALAASDVAVVPSVRDESGNVDGLPNVVLESLASATPARRDRRGWHRQRGEARSERAARWRNAIPPRSRARSIACSRIAHWP